MKGLRLSRHDRSSFPAAVPARARQPIGDGPASVGSRAPGVEGPRFGAPYRRSGAVRPVPSVRGPGIGLRLTRMQPLDTLTSREPTAFQGTGGTFLADRIEVPRGRRSRPGIGRCLSVGRSASGAALPPVSTDRERLPGLPRTDPVETEPKSFVVVRVEAERCDDSAVP
jgi:hypothetical protein